MEITQEELKILFNYAAGKFQWKFSIDIANKGNIVKTFPDKDGY